ncbi:MAG: RAMP superfamily protein [Pseudanabaenaceae cyanobacterium]
MTIPNAERKVPMAFRAQVSGRCQLQYLDDNRRRNQEPQDGEIWVKEWIDRTDRHAPLFEGNIQSRTYELSWRFVTNGGQDDGIIRPVIGAKGWPFYPGSSMKGLFRSACTPAQRDRYCGKPLPGNDWAPGILRFLGGYPADARWRDRLLDLVHPQQTYQVQNSQASHGAFLLVSLYRPKLRFGISCAETLSDEEWKEIWDIWERAIAQGLGSRVSAGYGQVAGFSLKRELLLYPAHHLEGQGMAAKTLDRNWEFRPNLFRAGIRGHALRIFGGLTSAAEAEQAVNQLFGSVTGAGDVGLLRMVWQENSLQLTSHGTGPYRVMVYNVEGRLGWALTQDLSEDQRKCLQNLLLRLNQFAMVFGGFGKSWRRIDHARFYPDYLEDLRKPYIGCHWQWCGGSQTRDVQVRNVAHVSAFIGAVQEAAQNWLQSQAICCGAYAQNWREAWHPSKVQVWGRVAEDEEDSLAVPWFHKSYRPGDCRAREGSIHRTNFAGGIGTVSRLWHRMYPLIQQRRDAEGTVITVITGSYLELLTLFPDSSAECCEFLKFLEEEQTDFRKLWGT